MTNREINKKLFELSETAYNNAEIIGKHRSKLDREQYIALFIEALGNAAGANIANHHANLEEFLKEFPVVNTGESYCIKRYKELIVDTVEYHLADYLIRFLDYCVIKDFTPIACDTFNYFLDDKLYQEHKAVGVLLTSITSSLFDYGTQGNVTEVITRFMNWCKVYLPNILDFVEIKLAFDIQ